MTKERSIAEEEANFVGELTRQYGPLLTGKEACALLKYKTPGALSTARKRGHIDISPLAMPGRKAHFYATEHVATILAKWKQSRDPAREKPGS
ncbi:MULTISPECIES: hypothetical protein [unclassified Hydrogenophaga]|uniref:hypothetical protein n=1 Tax=unclassified Hydrogenophaga TaxID=2610897 RepID=UPI0013201170|nr:MULTISPECIES: hypothetical protein [unclassified Hydrogenophaga]MDP3350490.1 hypothetical protein [Hydrogenophaga sp.]QHE78576.1 hypothetical protein F9Z45_20720 [Hydrogenophaga sp. PBL-H3]QHE83001.1 hypothetical protein F9Z44_20720 [Hydrogenophaga sp. PBL-H3]